MEGLFAGLAIGGIPVAIMAWYFIICDDIYERREQKRKALKKARKKEKKRLKALAAAG